MTKWQSLTWLGKNIYISLYVSYRIFVEAIDNGLTHF